jgi:hypothetical protein
MRPVFERSWKWMAVVGILVSMRACVRWIVVVVLMGHGLVHLLGAAKGLGWAEVTPLQEPIGTATGVAWLMAAVLVVGCGGLLAVATSWWWVVGAVAVVVSQGVIFTSWSDAKVGTVGNVVLLLAVVYGYASHGPASYRAEYDRRAAAALTQPLAAGVVTEADLAAMPEPVAGYVRRSGAVGQPRVTNFHARIHGRIRSGATKPWMTFTGEQVNTCGSEPRRLFLLDATMFGLPVDVLHVFVGRSASMRVRLCSLVPIVNATGPIMDRAETVTLFNDMCVLAPAALVDAPITWRTLDDHHVQGMYTKGMHTVTAVLAFNDDHELVDFVSDDRQRAPTDSSRYTPLRWSTPVGHYRSVGNRWVATYGEGRWHAPDPEGEFTYIEFSIDHLAFNTMTVPTRGTRTDVDITADATGRRQPVKG